MRVCVPTTTRGRSQRRKARSISPCLMAVCSAGRIITTSWDHTRRSFWHLDRGACGISAERMGRLAGRAMTSGVVNPVAARVYRWVGTHRHLLPGGAPSCAPPPNAG